MGTAWILGCLVFGSIVTNHSKECQISRQYLCQASLAIVGISIFSITSVTGYNGYVSFALVYGFFQGGHCYSLKMYVYYKVRARNFARTWSFTQFCMGLPSLIGIPLTGIFCFKKVVFLIKIALLCPSRLRLLCFQQSKQRVLLQCRVHPCWQPGLIAD